MRKFRAVAVIAVTVPARTTQRPRTRRMLLAAIATVLERISSVCAVRLRCNLSSNACIACAVTVLAVVRNHTPTLEIATTRKAWRAAVVASWLAAASAASTAISNAAPDDPIPYCLSYIDTNKSCDREARDDAWVCRDARHDLVQARCLKWDETSILQFCRGWTEGNSIFGEVRARSCLLGGGCYVDRAGIPPAFVCLNPK